MADIARNASQIHNCNEAYFFDNENGFVEKAEYKNGSLVINSNNVPEWLKEFEQLLNNNMI